MLNSQLPSFNSNSIGAYRFVAPSTIPMMLYRFEKNVNQSSNTFFWSSGRSDQSGRTSSAFVEVMPRAREASWPANTVWFILV